MLNEVQECEGYLKYLDDGFLRDGDNKDPETSMSIVRMLRILARHYWYEDDQVRDPGKKVAEISKKLERFFKIVTAENADAKDKGIDPRLKRYNEPFFEYSGNFFTFYSIIADAVNDGPLCGGYDGAGNCPKSGKCSRKESDNGEPGLLCTEKGRYTLLISELLYLLKLADDKNARLMKKHSKTEFSKLQIGDAVVARVAGLIVYYRCYKNKHALPDGSIPVSVSHLNSWLGSKYLEKGKAGQQKWVNVCSFVDLATREHSTARDDGPKSYFLKIKEDGDDGLDAKVMEMIYGISHSKKAVKKKDFDGWRLTDNDLSDTIEQKIKEIRNNPVFATILK